MSWWVIGTEHLARCVCTPESNDGCPFHDEPVRVFPPTNNEGES